MRLRKSGNVVTAGKTGTLWATAALVISGISGFVVTLIAARVLEPARYAEFSTAWASLYMLVAALNGIQQEVSRSIAAHVAVEDVSRTREEPIGLLRAAVVCTMVWSLAVCVILCVVVPRLPQFATLWLLVPAGFFIAGEMLICGLLAGMGRMQEFAYVLILEASTRFLLFVVAAVWGSQMTVSVLFVFAVVPFAAWLLLLPRLRLRLPRWSDSGAWRSQSLRFMTVGMATLLTGVLTTGIPVVISVAGRHDDPAAVGTLILLITITRAPLMMPLASFQSALVGHFVRLGKRMISRLMAAIVGTLALGVVVAGLAGWLGPELLGLLFGETYGASARTFFWITLSAVGLAVQTETGATALASGSQRAYLASWAVTAAITIGLFFTPIELIARTALALGIGPLIGAILAGVWAFARIRSASDDGLPQGAAR